MRHWRKLLHRLRSLLTRGALDRELEREIAIHLDALTQEGIAAGLTEAEAQQAAVRAFGPRALVEERCRDTRRVNLLYEAVADLRSAWRLLRRAREVYPNGKSQYISVGLANLGSVYLNQRQYGAAEHTLREAVSLSRELLSEDHLNTAIAEIKLGTR